MPNIGALWAEMRVGGGWGEGVQAVFVAKIKKYLGTFCRWVACSENSCFSESTL